MSAVKNKDNLIKIQQLKSAKLLPADVWYLHFWNAWSILCHESGVNKVLYGSGSVVKQMFLIPFFSPSGVADGVGGWRDYGVDPSQFSATLMKTCERLVKEGRFTPSNPVGILTSGYYELLQNKVPLLGEYIEMIHLVTNTASGGASSAVLREINNIAAVWVTLWVLALLTEHRTQALSWVILSV